MAATDRETPSICPECESGVHVACRDEPGTSAECACLCGEAPSAAQGQDDTLGVVWDKPDGRGGWISEASCWVEGCHVRVEGYDREEVERLLGEHHETFHGGTDAE